MHAEWTLLDDAAFAFGLLLEGHVLHLRLVAARHCPSGHVHVARRRRLVLPRRRAAVGAILVRRARHRRLQGSRREYPLARFSIFVSLFESGGGDVPKSREKRSLLIGLDRRTEWRVSIGDRTQHYCKVRDG